MFLNKKKKYFKHKLDGVQKMIWDNEFKREKSLMIKEEVRSEYDAVSSKLYMTTEKIREQLSDPDKICEVHNQETGKEKVHKDKGVCTCEYKEGAMPVADIEGLYDKKEILALDQVRYQKQIDGLDVEIHGSKKTDEYPDGADGIDQTIESLYELMGMIKEYIKGI